MKPTNIIKYINPFTDFGFKRIFGQEDNKDLLLDFLNELLNPQGITIKELSYKNNAKLPISAEERKVIFDLYCENENGDKFTIELQKAKQSNFKDRMLYYSTFSIQEQGVKGKWDYKLKAVYVIAILDFAFESIVSEKVTRYVKLFDIETNEVFSEKLNFITIEMPNFTKTEAQLETNLDKWLYLLKHLHELENIPAKLQTSILEKVFKIAEYSAMPQKARQQYEESLKAYNDLNNVITTSESIGFQKASDIYEIKLQEARIREEEERKQKEEAKNKLRKTVIELFQMNIPIEKIVGITGISEAEIKTILA